MLIKKLTAILLASSLTIGSCTKLDWQKNRERKEAYLEGVVVKEYGNTERKSLNKNHHLSKQRYEPDNYVAIVSTPTGTYNISVWSAENISLEKISQEIEEGYTIRFFKGYKSKRFKFDEHYRAWIGGAYSDEIEVVCKKPVLAKASK